VKYTQFDIVGYYGVSLHPSVKLFSLTIMFSTISRNVLVIRDTVMLIAVK